LSPRQPSVVCRSVRALLGTEPRALPGHQSHGHQSHGHQSQPRGVVRLRFVPACLRTLLPLMIRALFANSSVPPQGHSTKKATGPIGPSGFVFGCRRFRERSFALSSPLAAGKRTRSGDHAEDNAQRSGFGNRRQLVLNLCAGGRVDEIHDSHAEKV